MVTTTCKELAGYNCTVPLSGNSVQELQTNVFSHAQQHHTDQVKRMTPQDQAKMIQRIEEIYKQKEAAAIGRS